MFRLFSLVCSVAFISHAAKAHEFWIDPEQHMVAAGEAVVAELRVGEMYDGARQSYLPPRFRRFDYAVGGAITPVPGRAGDRPAVNLATADAGLLVLIHVTEDSTLTYRGMEKFAAFVEHKDAAWTLETHEISGFPTDSFKEIYSRYAKSLIAVDDGAGADVVAGLETEIVALENPYTGNVSDGMDVQLFYRDAPRENAQIEVFAKAPDGSVEVFTVRTDDDGKATVPVSTGHRYMLDAVVLRVPETEDADIVWESLWANLTFQIP